MRWYRSLYWRIAFGVMAFLVTMLVVQAMLFVWAVSQSGRSLRAVAGALCHDRRAGSGGPARARARRRSRAVRPRAVRAVQASVLRDDGRRPARHERQRIVSRAAAADGAGAAGASRGRTHDAARRADAAGDGPAARGPRWRRPEVRPTSAPPDARRHARFRPGDRSDSRARALPRPHLRQRQARRASSSCRRRRRSGSCCAASRRCWRSSPSACSSSAPC